MFFQMRVEQKNPKAFSLAVRVYEELFIGVSRCFAVSGNYSMQMGTLYSSFSCIHHWPSTESNKLERLCLILMNYALFCL